MIIFEDIESEIQMKFGTSKENLFYVQMCETSASAYNYFIELEDDEVQHLINTLNIHLENKKNE